MKKERIFQQLIYWPTFLALKFFFRYKVSGQENLKGLEGKPVIFVSRHFSYADGPICAAAMPREGVVPKNFFPVKFMVSEVYCERETSPFPFPLSAVVKTFLDWNRVIPTPVVGEKGYESKNPDALDGVVDLMKKYPVKVWIFPEGRISKDGKMHRIRGGAVYLHQKTVAIVVPVALGGLLGISFKSIFRRRITIRFGEPLARVPGGIEGSELIKEKLLELERR